jgi:acyl-CoA synthetase (AMP-forming)/AMP-acid ligase II
VSELVSFLAGRLPGFMIPALWAIVAEFPLTATGKIDRDALRRSARPAAAYGG